MTEDFDFGDMAEQLADLGQVSDDNFSEWDTLRLTLELADLDAKLSSRKELLHPTTQEARDLHSRRGAIVVTLRRRST